MKRTLLITAIAAGLYYLLKDKQGKKKASGPVRKNHLTTAFSEAKTHAVND